MVFGEVVPGENYTKREAVYGIFIDLSGKIALIKTPRGCFLHGGGLEGSETHAECLVRESIEETGFFSEPGEKICTSSFFDYVEKFDGYYELFGHFYSASFIRDTGMPSESDKVLEWFDIRRAPDVIRLPHQAWAVSLAASRITVRQRFALEE